jgi:uncharacterized protein YcsI (UPF0317 family)
MYRTNIACVPAGPFRARWSSACARSRAADVARVVQICERFTVAHGAPVHVGNPAAIGIADLQRPDYGDAVSIAEDEVPCSGPAA